jgi:hypothetical protein
LGAAVAGVGGGSAAGSVAAGADAVTGTGVAADVASCSRINRNAATPRQSRIAAATLQARPLRLRGAGLAMAGVKGVMGA